MAIVVGFTATLLYGGTLALEGTLAVGAYSMLIFLTQRLLWPLTRLGATFDVYQRAMASTTRVLDLLATKIEITSGTEHIEAVEGEIRFEGVDFAYPGRDPLLQDFNLTVKAGETVAIVGSTGAGKSSLIRLLMRFYDVQGGRVTLDGQDIRTLRLDTLRGAVGLVTQHTFLFPGSVAENLRYGAPNAPLERLQEAAVMAEARQFVDALPQGFDTTIGEEGQKLSGGQRQRLAIARAVLCDAPVLVLDEATSAVDNETEAAIQRSLETISRGKTTLVIAHRLSTIRHADRIVVLDAGRIAEQGTHDDLVARGGQYARLWAVQTGEAA
jgi:ATP-binding cassette subfamily B protein